MNAALGTGETAFREGQAVELARLAQSLDTEKREEATGTRCLERIMSPQNVLRS